MSRIACLVGGALLIALSLVSPAEARFGSVDPVQPNHENGEHFNRYHYAEGNPYRYTDPDGRQAKDMVKGAVRIVHGAIKHAADKNTGRGKNNLKPDPAAVGDHSTFKVDAHGRTTHTATYQMNPQNPSGFQEIKRVDITGRAHTNSDRTVVPTPHVKEAGSRNVRPATPDELPLP